MREFKDMFRPNYDAVAALTWMVSIVLLLLFRPPGWQLFIGFSLNLCLLRWRQMLDLYRFRLSISSLLLTFIPIDALTRKCQEIRLKRKSFWLGTGFIWSQVHAETARQIVYRNPGEITDLPLPVKALIERTAKIVPEKRNFVQRQLLSFYARLMPKDAVEPSDGAIGVPWIHGIGNGVEEDIVLPLDAMTGHTQILGTTRAGKTRFYEILCTQVIHAGDTLIVIDPKKDRDWIARLRKECERKKRKFLYFDMARPEISIRLDPLASWNNLTEIATRISQLIDAEGTFAAFSWKTLHFVQRGMVAAGIKPNIRNTREIILLGAEDLTEKVLDTYFTNKLGAGWDRDIPTIGKNAKPSKDPLPDSLVRKISFYRSQSNRDDAIDGLISMVEHDRSHYTKLRETLIPILEMLGSGEVGKMLSPDAADIDDTREMWTIKKIVEEKAVLYVGLDSLTNATVASAIGSILLADLASTAGEIYNFQTPARTYVVIDEASEVLNAQVTQILNKGGGADFRCFVASQSIADYDVRYGTRPKAMQAMASLNNLICFRIKDPEAAQLASEMFGVTEGRQIETSMSTGAESMTNATEFRTQTSRSLSSTEIPLVSAQLLTRLPPLHFFAFIAARNIVKGRLHLIKD